MACCFISECKHDSRRDTCKFFRFPSNEVECRMWNEAVAQVRPGTSDNRICSCHFENGIRAYGPKKIRGMSKNLSQAGTSAVSQADDGSQKSIPNLSLMPRLVPIRRSNAYETPDKVSIPLSSPNLCLAFCFVPMCSNTYETVGKVFIPFPESLTMRKKWCDAIKYQVSIRTRAFCCSDHFDLENDMENYTKWCSKPGTTIKMKPSVVPHIFTCQGRSSQVGDKQELEQRRKLHVERLLRVRIEERNQELLKESNLLLNKVAAWNRELHETGRVITPNEEIAEERLIRERIETHNQELLEGSQKILEENGKTLDQLVEENLRESELWNQSSSVDQSEEYNNVEIKEEAEDETEVECSLGQISDGVQSFVSINMNVVNNQTSENNTNETEADVEIKQEYPEENIGDDNIELGEFLDVKIKEEIDDTAFDNNSCNEDENDLTDGNSYTASQHHVELKEERDGEFNLDVKHEYEIVDRSELDEENQCHRRIHLEHDYYKTEENTQGRILQTKSCNFVLRKKIKLKKLISLDILDGNQSDSFMMLKTDAVKYILDENGEQGQRRCFLMKNNDDCTNDLYEVFEKSAKTFSDGNCQADFFVQKKDESVQCLRKRKMVDVSISTMPMKRSVDASTSCMELDSGSSSELDSESSNELDSESSSE